MISTNTELPLNDEASGIRALDARQDTRGGLAIVVGLLSTAFALGMVAGALIVTALLLIFKT